MKKKTKNKLEIKENKFALIIVYDKANELNGKAKLKLILLVGQNEKKTMGNYFNYFGENSCCKLITTQVRSISPIIV